MTGGYGIGLTLFDWIMGGYVGGYDFSNTI